MKTLILAALFTVSLAARPPMETFTAAQTQGELRGWLRGNQNAIDRHGGIAISQVSDLSACLKVMTTNRPGDVMLYVLYRPGDPIAKGDLFVFRWQKGYTVREVAAVGTGYVQTVFGTKIPAADVEGLVKRVIRVTP